MFWDDIKLITGVINKYGLREPFVDLGGEPGTACVDYERTIKTGDQKARGITLDQVRPYSHIVGNDYMILNPAMGHPIIEELPKYFNNYFGTIICTNVIEHVYNPFNVFAALYKMLKENGLIILETVFSFPYHGRPPTIDFWRYSPYCLKYLGETAGFIVVEYDWRLNVYGDQGVRCSRFDVAQEVKSVYVVLSKGEFKPIDGCKQYELPKIVEDK
jgi:hypothetical protein